LGLSLALARGFEFGPTPLGNRSLLSSFRLSPLSRRFGLLLARPFVFLSASALFGLPARLGTEAYDSGKLVTRGVPSTCVSVSP
jgi:hypothetical protein